MSEWREYLLEDIIDTFIDYRGKTPKKSDSGIPLVTAKVVKSGKILTPNEFIPADEYENWMTRGYPKKNDVVLTTEAPLGEVALIKDENIALAQRIITMRGNPEFVSNVFLKYYLQSDQGQYELDSRASGTTVFGIKAAVLRQVPVLLPELSEQNAIASVLSSLDDKIDLLHRQNQTLEQMAETLYDAWFEEKELTSLVSDLISLQNGYAFKSKSFQDFGVDRVLKIKNISGGIVDIEATDYVSHETVENLDEKFSISTGDILFAMTGAKIGKMGIIPKTDYKLWLNQRVGLFKEKYYGSRFLAYLHLKSDYGKDYIENTATGSAQPNISGTGIENCEFPEITKQEIIDYSKQLAPLYEKVIFNLGQIRKLEALRDTLLPKLMSGEIRIDTDD